MEWMTSTIEDFLGDHPGDWTEDRAKYLNQCCVCGAVFSGGKRRIVCRTCHHESTIQPS